MRPWLVKLYTCGIKNMFDNKNWIVNGLNNENTSFNSVTDGNGVEGNGVEKSTQTGRYIVHSEICI